MNRSWIVLGAAVVGSWVAAFFGAYLAVSVRLASQAEMGPSEEGLALPDGISLPLDGRSLGESGKGKADASRPLPEPGRLPASVPATALEVRRDPSAEAVRTVIKEEMPDATPDEVEVWAEELKGLGPEAAREILKLRNAIGRPWETSRGSPAEQAPPPSEPRPVRYVDLP